LPTSPDGLGQKRTAHHSVLFLHPAIFFLLLLSTAISAAGAERTALVIGNARYEAKVGALRNTVNDAKAMGAVLKGLGFEVLERENLNRKEMLEALEQFRQTLPGAEIALFYYAGHGLSIDGANYLVPLRSGFEPSGDGITSRLRAETRLFNAAQAVADMSDGGAQCNLVILDACRTSRLVRTTRSLPAGGLAEMTPPAGSLIAFATDAGATADDGAGDHGLYTEQLMRHLQSPGLTIEQVFKRTREAVMRMSDGKQVPAEYSRLIGADIYLAGRQPLVLPAEPVEPPPASEPALEKVEALIESGDTAEALEELAHYARTHGNGEYAVDPLETILDHAKESLKTPSITRSTAAALAHQCEIILEILPISLPGDHPRAAYLTSKAANRRGDALMILERHHEALAAYNLALTIAPEDAYIRFNRGRAHEALGQFTEAKADFQAASAPGVQQTGARRLAREALDALDDRGR